MTGRKNEPRDHRGEGDVGGARNRPAAHQLTRPVHRDHHDVDQRGRRHPADGGRKRRQCPPRRGERSARQRGLEHFLRRQRKEEHHADVVGREVQVVGEMLVTREIEVGPDHRGDGSREQQQRIVEDEAHAERSRKPFWRRDLRPSSDCNCRIMSGFTPRSPWTRQQYARHTGHATTGSVGSRHERRLPRWRAVPTLVERNEE